MLYSTQALEALCALGTMHAELTLLNLAAELFAKLMTNSHSGRPRSNVPEGVEIVEHADGFTLRFPGRVALGQPIELTFGAVGNSR